MVQNKKVNNGFGGYETVDYGSPTTDGNVNIAQIGKFVHKCHSVLCVAMSNTIVERLECTTPTLFVFYVPTIQDVRYASLDIHKGNGTISMEVEAEGADSDDQVKRDN